MSHSEPASPEVTIDLGAQHLSLMSAETCTFSCPMSSAANGPGERNGSFCTPRGWHVIRAKIGDQAPVNTVFRGRRPTAELFAPALRRKYPERDWILTRILWLSGLEPGRNRLGEVDTMRRYIYIHGCPDDVELGKPGSLGCIRVSNGDVVRLFDLVSAGTRVNIV